MTDFFNAYEDRKLAEAYAKLEFPGTYFMAFRDLPKIIAKHVAGKRVLIVLVAPKREKGKHALPCNDG